jgi:hypothetical protein
VRGVTFGMSKRTFDLKMSAKVENFIIEDRLQPFGEDFQYLAVASSEQSLLDIDFLYTERVLILSFHSYLNNL